MADEENAWPTFWRVKPGGPAIGCDGENVKAAVSAGTTVTGFDFDATWAGGPPESVTVSITGNVPEERNAWPTFWPVTPGVPSPNSHVNVYGGGAPVPLPPKGAASPATALGGG